MADNSKNFGLENISCYVTASELSKLIYDVVKKWNYLDQRTVGVQVIRSVDSIAANIAEGFGRYHKKDKIKFFINARGSVYESMHWVKLASQRELINVKIEQKISGLIERLPKEVNYLIKSTNNNLTI